MLLCEETIPGSPAPVCPKEQCDSVKKNYDSMFASPHPADIETKVIPIDTDASNIDSKSKSKNATPGSSPRDSMSQDDSSEENNKKQGLLLHFEASFTVNNNDISISFLTQKNKTVLFHQRKDVASKVKLSQFQSDENRSHDEIQLLVSIHSLNCRRQ